MSFACLLWKFIISKSLISPVSKGKIKYVKFSLNSWDEVVRFFEICKFAFLVDYLKNKQFLFYVPKKRYEITP